MMRASTIIIPPEKASAKVAKAAARQSFTTRRSSTANAAMNPTAMIIDRMRRACVARIQATADCATCDTGGNYDSASAPSSPPA